MQLNEWFKLTIVELNEPKSLNAHHETRCDMNASNIVNYHEERKALNQMN